jgi:glycosyltransferase involved in cell wall biosynthesis
LKVLFCTNAFENVSNGPAKFAHLLLEGAANMDFEVRILTEDVFTETSSVYKLNLHILKPFKVFGVFIRMVKYHRAAMKIRYKYSYDILVYNNAMIGLLSFIFFKKTVGMINDYSNAEHSMMDVLRGKTKLNKRILFFYVEHLTCYFSKCIIVNSKYLKQLLHQRYRCNESLFKVLYKGIEDRLVSFDREEAIKKKIAGSILFVKTDFELGGLYNLINALKNINRKVKLTIVGPAKEHQEMLTDRLNRAQISFELFGYMKQEEVYKKMQQTEIFCVPSKREAFGVANLEALALGCKIVSTNVGGIPEAMNGNRFARLVKPDDSVALGEAIMKAIDTSIEEDLDDISNHLNHFSSVKVVSNFKKYLQACF